MHSLIPSQYGDSVLTRLANNDTDLQDIFDLDHATNDRLLAEHNQAIGISALELVSGFPHYRIVNAAFCHPNPRGGRFNTSIRGAWYAGFDFNTALSEVVFHKTQHLREINHLYDEVTFDDYLADFHGDFYDICNSTSYQSCLKPNDYSAGHDRRDGFVFGCSLWRFVVHRNFIRGRVIVFGRAHLRSYPENPIQRPVAATVNQVIREAIPTSVRNS